ncbi:carboxypeptidase-like regulatory domain-containing protein [Flavobacterium sp. UBA6135]|uniref:carboxypeptidase-like regulatory domain-containing protein n=1 Tax=Flavobacterium sp. UBA6135 TaxID=1946553 RepID=UPI0025BF0082|nr:carboxypeptidase-like regulatory domain-containing protein [Flavobacterium sp. UBA6135]
MLKYFFLFLIIFKQSFSQSTITGTIIDENNIGIEGVNVVLKEINNESVINYTTSQINGLFKITNKSKSKKILISLSALGYESFSQEIEITNNEIDIGVFTIKSNPFELKEVILESQRNAIITKGDTTIYNVNRFLNGTEDSLKDLLENIPGIRISSKGRIEVNGKEITELLIDGDNLYKNQHKLATDNLPSNIVKSIEFYNNHVPFDKIKKDSLTGDTALNIIIKEEYKKKIKGNLQSNYNFINRYNLHSSLYNFNSKNKFSLITNSNNLGNAPMGIEDYYQLIDNNNISKSDESTVIFSTINEIPKFLTSGENVASKKNTFLNISNISNISKKTKVHFYTILNRSSQKEIYFNNQRFIDTNIDFYENSDINENSFFANLNLSSTHKFNSNTLFKMTNNVLIDNLNKEDNLINDFVQEESVINQSNDSKILKIQNRIEFSKKIKKSYFSTKVSHNIDKTSNQNNINGNFDLFDFDLMNSFAQRFSKNNSEFHLLSEYSIQLNKFNPAFKLFYENSNFEFKNWNDVEQNYQNFFSIIKNVVVPEINLTYLFSNKLSTTFTGKYNITNQNYNSNTENANYFGYMANLKYKFNSNSILQLNNSISNNLANRENLFNNEFVKDYRTVFRNSDLKSNTLFPLKKIGVSYLKTNPITNTFLIINLNHSWTNKAENINFINGNNFNIYESRISPKQEMSNFVLFYQKNFNKIPFSSSLNFDVNYISRDFYINNNLANFKSIYTSYYVQLKSKFKKAPVHFEVGFKYSQTNFDNNDNLSSNVISKVHVNINGLAIKNLYWRINSSHNNFKTDLNKSVIKILSPSLRYSEKDSKWEFVITGHNILNFNSTLFVSNQSDIGYESITSNNILPGYLNFGLKYKF